MTDSKHSGFGKSVPGFDFLQTLAKSQNFQMPAFSNWVAPTLDPKELDKRIDELKAVQFWLDQNTTALKATIQALEVQKMTLATLKGMNFDMSAMANAFKFPAAAPQTKPHTAAESDATAQRAKHADDAAKPAGKAAKPAAPVDPMQLWGSLAQQFQTIAAGAMQEVARHAAAGTAKPAAAEAGGKKAAAPKAAKKTGARAR
jgi:hypothetical protein